MKVKITKASEDSYWYSDHIGEVFEVKIRNRRYEKEYEVIGEAESERGFGIALDDCEIVQ